MDDQLTLQIDETAALRDTWEQALRLAERRLGREAVEGWLRDAQPLSLEEGRLVLAVPNATARTWIEKKYAPTLRQALTAVRGNATEVAIVQQAQAPAPRPPGRGAPRTPGRPSRPAVSALFAPSPLKEKYTFDHFVVGQSNRFARAAAGAVAESPGRGFNPLFIYGGVGLGKTHLLQAIGHALREREPGARLAYVSGETFTSHFVTSLREHREEEFRRAYRSIDVWLVDDIQFIADKSSTKEEFFHTFNELYLTNRQIVLAADRPPNELRLMEDRLRSRLQSGLMVEIGEPELETRVAILQKRAALEGAPEIPEDVLYQIAHAVKTNVRILEAALIRMIALASLTGCPLTPEVAARAIAAFVQEGRLTGISLLVIQRAVCEQFRIPPEDLTSPRRDRPICLARQVAMYLMRELTRQSLAEIGRMFGGKAHSTVIYACDKLEKEMQTDADLALTVRSLKARLAGDGAETRAAD
jgi:chromosomal replication initiator protein